MTAVPHDRVVRAMRSGRGSRLVRPSSRVRLAVGEGRDTVAGLDVGTASPGWLAALGATISVDHLRLVLAGRRVRLGNGAFVLAMLAALSGMLILLLILNTALTTDSFELQQLRSRDNKLTVQEQQLAGELAAVRSPLAFQARARELGMVPAAVSPVFLSLDQGKVLGEAQRAPMPATPEPPKAKPAVTIGVDGFPPASDIDGGESAAVAVGAPGADAVASAVGGVGDAVAVGPSSDAASGVTVGEPSGAAAGEQGAGQRGEQGAEQGLGLVGVGN